MLLALAVAGGCASAVRWDSPTPDSYTVKAGDTLYGIAWRHGVDYRDLAAWNRLGSGTLIRPGQVLTMSGKAGAGRVAAPKSTPRAPPASQPDTTTRPAPPVTRPPAWAWPAGGAIVAEFGASPGPRTGALIAGKRRDPVRSAAPGRVVYAGSGLIGYGKLIIVKHNESYLSAYGHNDEMLVAEGDVVGSGQQIARMGLGPGQVPRLHFEIRENGKPVNPRRFLPAR